MANFLQRIADSGARTSSVVKPPAAARGLMPPIAPLPPPALGDEAPEQWDVSSVPPISAPGSVLQGAELGMPEPSPRDSQRHEIETGISARTQIPGPPRVASQSPRSRVAIRAPEALRSFVSGVPREHSIHKIAEETTRTFIPRTLLNRTASESSEKQEKISVPRTAHRIPVQNEASLPEPIVATTQVPRVPNENARAPESSFSLQPTSSVTHSSAIPVSEIRRFQAEPASAPPGPRPPAQPAESRRRAQISIGRIDVQVNNQAPQPATPQPSRAAARMNSLEQHYLGRFFISL
jgi:hypothetical protein